MSLTHKHKDGEEQPRAGYALWTANKDMLKWIIAFIVSALVGYGGAKVKFEQMQTDIATQKVASDKNTEQIVELRIENASLKTALDALKEDNNREHRDIKRSIKP
jgi:hypothetical protein